MLAGGGRQGAESARRELESVAWRLRARSPLLCGGVHPLVTAVWNYGLTGCDEPRVMARASVVSTHVELRSSGPTSEKRKAPTQERRRLLENQRIRVPWCPLALRLIVHEPRSRRRCLLVPVSTCVRGSTDQRGSDLPPPTSLIADTENVGVGDNQVQSADMHSPTLSFRSGSCPARRSTRVCGTKVRGSVGRI